MKKVAIISCFAALGIFAFLAISSTLLLIELRYSNQIHSEIMAGTWLFNDVLVALVFVLVCLCSSLATYVAKLRIAGFLAVMATWGICELIIRKVAELAPAYLEAWDILKVFCLAAYLVFLCRAIYRDVKAKEAQQQIQQPEPEDQAVVS